MLIEDTEPDKLRQKLSLSLHMYLRLKKSFKWTAWNPSIVTCLKFLLVARFTLLAHHSLLKTTVAHLRNAQITILVHKY